MAENNIKIINITLNPFDVQTVESNFEIRGGENVRFIFALPEGVKDIELTGNGTLQVQAINAINGFEGLAKEGTYTVGALSELNAQIEFSSAETAYAQNQAGAYNLIVALKDEMGNIVVSGVLPFNLYNVGYTGIVEPPQSIRDTILDEIESARQESLTDIAEAKQESLTDIAGAKKDALDGIQVYTDPEGRIARLEKNASKEGGFYFNGGSLKNTTAQISVPFSVCATIDSQYNGTIFTVGNTSAGITDGVITLSDGINSVSTSSVSNDIHALVFVITSAGAKIFADGVQAAIAATFVFSSTSAGYEFWKNETGFGGRISRAKIFNFDMSASGAAYTPQDYANGIEPNGLILAGGTSYTQDNMWIRFAASYTVVKDGGIGLTFTDPYSISYGLMYLNSSSPIPAGSTVKISCGEDIGDAKTGSIQVQIQTESRANQGYAYVYPSGTKKTNTIVTTGDATRIEVWFNKDASVSSLAGKTLKTSSLEVRINGAIVNLADFAQGYQAQDTSANGNHAMLIGTALADKTAAQALVRGSYTWSGSTGAYWLADSNVLPSNCQVELWAKASAAATLNLGYDTGHATAFGSAKSVSTSWASVASWTMGAIPRKLFVSPSAADLSVQFYLKITSIR